MSLKTNKFLIFTISITLLAGLILLDPRGNIISEPFAQHKLAFSIAISHVVYGVEGFVGLKEVHDHLSEIPNITDYSSRYYSILGGFLLNFENINEIAEYSKIISKNIIDSKNLIITNISNLHTYQNDIGYVFYIIFSFLLFGVSLKSISLFFLLIVIFSSVIFMINFYKNNLYFFLLQTVLFALIITIIGSYGASIQIVSINNQRLLSILSIIPVLHLSLAFLSKENIKPITFFLSLLQIIILVFLCHVRGTAFWSFLSIFLFYLTWTFYVGIKKFSEHKINVMLMTISVFLFLIFFNLSNLLIKNNLGDIYKDETTITKHMFWHNLVMGITMTEKIHERYVCSDVELEDIWGMDHIACGTYPLLYKNVSQIYKDIVLYHPRDVFSNHAAIKYIHDNKLNEQIGASNEKNLILNMNWSIYEKILKKIYLNILTNEPIEFLYIHIVVKPLKLIHELIKFTFYLFNSIYKNLIFTSVIFLGSLILQLFCMKKINTKENLLEAEAHNNKYLIEIILLLMFSACCVPSIIFYPSPGSAALDSVAILIVLFMFYIKRKFIKT